MASAGDPRSAIVAAEVAVTEEDYQAALDALHEAKSRVMRCREGSDE